MTPYDYWIELPSTPAFEENIQAMTDLIADDGESPTILERTSGNFKNFAFGTHSNSGLEMFHFRLPERYDAIELIDYLTSVMTSPIPPITVQAIRSAYKIDNGEYETIMVPSKAQFLPYMNSVPDGSGGERPPNANDDLWLSGYFGTDPMELI